MSTHAIRRERGFAGEGLSTPLLLLLLLLCVTGSVDAANWADGLGILSWAAIAGLVAGIFLAKSPLADWAAHLLLLGAGITVVVWLGSTLLPDTMTLPEKVVALQDRFWIWASQARFGGASTDNVMFVIQVAYLAWIMAYLAGWSVYREHTVWGALIPTGMALLFNLYYALPQSGFYLGSYILIALLLIVRVNLQGMERRWRANAIGYPGDIDFDVLGYGVLFSIALMLVVWLLPATAPSPAWLPALEPLQGPWQRAEEEFTRVFGALRAVARPAGSAFAGSTLMMGGPVHLGNEPVMDVTAAAGRYWRATTYDKYTGIGWLNTHTDPLNLTAGDPRLDVSPGLSRIEITQTIKLYQPDQNILYAQAQPIRFDQPVEVRYGPQPQAPTELPALDVSLTRARRTLRSGDTYVAVSDVSLADLESLRQAGTDYPEWIASTYLRLPEELPVRVQDLASQITAIYANPYDKAAGIERYLRATIRYDENVSAPPQNRDGVDYTLFDRRAGYCNYYASAMAVLARAAGIPARVVSGYAFGDYADGTYHLVQAHAHAWVEVYFPTYGWIEFEPTSTRPTINRIAKSAGSQEATDGALDDLRPPRGRLDKEGLNDADSRGSGAGLGLRLLWQEPVVAGTAGGLALLGLAGIGLIRQRRRHAATRVPLMPAARFYARLLNRARWLGIDAQEHTTPLERGRTIAAALPRVRAQIEQATALYVREKYGAQPLDKAERAQLNATWGRVRIAWWRAMAIRLANRLVSPPRRAVRRWHRALDRWGKV